MINQVVEKLKTDKMIKQFVFILLTMQPVLDIISFFMVENNLSIFTTLLRLAIFGIVTLYAFLISDQKKYYYIMACALGVFWIFHMAACFSEGYVSLYQDITMYVRTVQVPIFTLAFITFFKQADGLKEQTGKIFWVNYIIISLSILLSFVVGMPEYTYGTGYGIKGWFYTGNAQSCIISIMAPLALCYAYRKKNNLFFLITIIIEYANLYFFGTRVALYTIFIVSLAFIFFLIWNREKRWGIYTITVGAVAVCLFSYPYSPCYLQQNDANISYNEWEEEIEEILPETEPTDVQYDMTYYEEIYNLYCGKLVERFGLEKVVDKYDYSTEVLDIISNRELKVNYGSLVMDEKNTLTHLFGFEYTDFLYNGEIFDPENDFPGLFYLCGYVGITLYALFIFYFVVVAMKSVIINKGKITLEKGMLGVSLVLMLGIAELSGNVLRRPNVSIYLSVMLAYLFVMCYQSKKKRHDEIRK